MKELRIPGVYAISIGNQESIINAIREQRMKNNWELFPPEQLRENAQEWEASLRTKIGENYSHDPEKAGTLIQEAAQAGKFLPLTHVIHPAFIMQAVEKGHIYSSSTREKNIGKSLTLSHTAEYEEALGFDQYVFLSTANWEGTSHGFYLYFPPEEILTMDETVVTVTDFAVIAAGFPNIPFADPKAGEVRDKITLLQRTAFTGKDFIKLLPLFLVAHYGDVKSPYQNSMAQSYYPEWFGKLLGNFSEQFRPEIKVRNSLPLSKEMRIGMVDPTPDNLAILAEDFEITANEEARIRDAFQGNIVDIPNGKPLNKWIETGRNWWPQEA